MNERSDEEAQYKRIYSPRSVHPAGLRFEPHLSVTQLKTFLRCPLKYSLKYIEKIEVPYPSALTLGRSVHYALEENYMQKLDTKRDLPLEQLLEFFSDGWEQGLPYTDFGEHENPGSIKDDGVKLLKVYHEMVAPKIQPALVEQEFGLIFKPLNYGLLGSIDLVDIDDCIIDHKTAKRSMTEGAANTDIQLSAYSLGYRELEGKPEKGLRFDVMIRTKEPKIQQLTTTREDKDLYRFLKLLEHAGTAISTGIYYPNENFTCPGCEYKEFCKRW